MDTVSQSPRPFRSLSTTLALSFFGLVVLVIATTSGLNIYFNYQKEQQIIASNETQVANNAAASVQSFIQEKANLLRTIMRLENSSNQSIEEQKLILDKLLGFEPSFRQLSIITENKEQLVQTSRLSNSTPIQLNGPVIDDLLATVKGDQNYFGPVNFDQSTQEPSIIIAVPLRNVFSDFKGAVVVEVNLKYMWDIVGNIHIGDQGVAYVVDKQGNLLAFGDSSRVLKRENLRDKEEVRQFMAGEQEIGRQTIDVSQGIFGTNVVSTFVPLKTPDWAVVVEEPVLEAYQPLIGELGFSVVIILFSLVISTGITIYLARRITSPIIQLTKTVRRVSAGDVSELADTSSANEVGELGASFNSMVVTLRDYQKGLEAKILERTGELQVEKDRAQAIISSMGEGLLAVDRDCNLTIINTTAEHLLGINARDYIGKPWSEIVTTMKGHEDVPVGERTFLQTLQKGEIIVTSLDNNHYYKTKQGRVFPVTSITAPLRKGDEIVGAVKVFQDATVAKEQKALIERTVEERTAELSQKNSALQRAQTDISNASVQIMEEKAKLTASIASLSLGFILTDTAENIVIMNPAARSILGLTEDVRQFGVIETILKDSCDLHKLHSDCKQENCPVQSQDIVFGAKFLKIFLTPIVSGSFGSQAMIGTVVLFEDVTEAKILERSKDEFFSIASHELRTPLTAIRGNTSMMLDIYKETLTDPDLIEMLKDINDSSVRLIEIVNDFLSVSRLEQRKMEFKKEPFDMVALVRTVIDELKVVKVQDGVELKIEGPADSIPQVLADQNKTKEVLINLIGNALKFTEKGEVAVQITTQGNQVSVAVRDTGRGLSVENQNLLFRKFQQAGDSLLTRDTTKGTGLGLYISKLMVEGMGGTIELVRSQLGEGSVFSFSLPLAK